MEGVWTLLDYSQYSNVFKATRQLIQVTRFVVGKYCGVLLVWSLVGSGTWT